MDIRFDEGAMRQVVSKAILEQVSPDSRDQIIAAAVESLLRPQRTSSWGAGPTPLQEAFDQAARIAVLQVARDVVAEHPEFLARVRGMVGDVVESVLRADDDGELRQRVADAVAGALIQSSLGRRE